MTRPLSARVGQHKHGITRGWGRGDKDRQRWLRYLANSVTCHGKPGTTAIRNTKPHLTSHFNLIPSSQLSDEKLFVGCFKALLLVKFLALHTIIKNQSLKL